MMNRWYLAPLFSLLIGLVSGGCGPLTGAVGHALSCDDSTPVWIWANEAPGIKVYQTQICGAWTHEYLAVIDLTAARIVSVTGPVLGTESPPHSVLTGLNARIGKAIFSSLLMSAGLGGQGAGVNGEFFDLGRDPTPLSFTVQQSGALVSVGNNMLTEFPGQIRLFRVNAAGDSADIIPFNSLTFGGDVAGYDMVIGALDEGANKGPLDEVGRTFLGVSGDGKTAYLYSSTAATQARAAGELRSFGATNVAMLSGGETSAFWVNGVVRHQGAAGIPHLLAAVPR